jgi:hypothetical protein
MHLVNFSFVTEESTAVSEALKFLAAFDIALVRAIMLVHMFARLNQYIADNKDVEWKNSPPFAFTIKELS